MKQYLHRILTCLTLCAILSGSLVTPASAAGFEDVPDHHWAAASIQQCVELGFFNGESATRFGVGHQMTRSAFTVVLCRFFGWETSASGQTVYHDVPTDAWYAGAVESAYTHGAITRQQESFRPADPITREELAVMLVRALGYGSIAGLEQNASHPFQDVTTNSGYIAMAYHLGLISGTSADTFSPSRPASREQVAVILMRLYGKLRENRPQTLVIADTAEALAGASVAAIPAAQLVYSRPASTMLPEDAAAVRGAARQAKIPALLYVTATRQSLTDINLSADTLLSAVSEAGYDGLFLEFSKLTRKSGSDLTQLVTKLSAGLGDKLLYLMVDAPAADNKANPYDYAALGKLADQLFVKIEPRQEASAGFMTAPPAPPEDIYSALTTLQSSVEQGKLSLMFSTAPSVWSKTKEYPMSAEEMAQLLEAEDTAIHFSQRYACSYFISPTSSSQTLSGWYLEEDTLDTRLQLAALLGAKYVCLIH